jgi:hypothetical protein
VATGASEQCCRNLTRGPGVEGYQVVFEAVHSELLVVVDADERLDASSLFDPDTIEPNERGPDGAGVRQGEYIASCCDSHSKRDTDASGIAEYRSPVGARQRVAPPVLCAAVPACLCASSRNGSLFAQ